MVLNGVPRDPAEQSRGLSATVQSLFFADASSLQVVQTRGPQADIFANRVSGTER